VQRTKDGQFILMHDATLDRTLDPNLPAKERLRHQDEGF
jgi:glycerophosphoryl diester phosphodiesterase